MEFDNIGFFFIDKWKLLNKWLLCVFIIICVLVFIVWVISFVIFVWFFGCRCVFGFFIRIIDLFKVFISKVIIIVKV